ncbi:MAG: bifunctional UDP-N-acetylglucosamine diphosphorylase/glucosamine-1-phosphate N-acetyltransferase GlmU [Bacilli bacterium]
MMNKFAVVLAAGKGTRMRSKLYKVLHPVCGKPMVQHVVDVVKQVGVTEVVTVVGHGAERVKEQLGDSVKYCLQSEQLGTAHAVMQASDLLEGKSGTTIVICGDTPLFQEETIAKLVAHHEQSGAKATILSSVLEDPTGYGRIVRGTDGSVMKNVEHKDASEEERAIREINTGTYCFDNESLFEALKLVSNDNAQGEYYLPDVLGILKHQGEKIEAYVTEAFEETLGVNDRYALSAASQIMKKRILKMHMLNGVTILDAESTYIEADVEIGSDTVIYPGTTIRRGTKIGVDCVIGPQSDIANSTIGANAVVRQSVVVDSVVGPNSAVGPFAHLRPGTTTGEDVRIGNFVELKKVVIDDGSKVSHLSYIGDATIGKNVNVGCGSITVNYDGKNKFHTTIADDCFVGCNSNLIAPVTLEKGSYIAAGSTITKDVPEQSLAIARARQEIKEGYAEIIKSKQNK